MDRRPEERLALIEITERDGRNTRLVDVHAWPLSVGRALDNSIVLDDPHVAEHHAVLAPDDNGALALQLLETHNGVQLNQRAIRSPGHHPLPAGGATLQLGLTQLRLRLPGETLPAEKAVPGTTRVSTRAALAAGAAVLALEFGSHWLGLDPGADSTAWLSTAIVLPLALALWCGAWALLSKLFRHQFDFIGHLRIAMPWMLAISLVDSFWPQLGASLASPTLWHLSGPIQVVLAALMVRQHLTHALPTHPRAVTAAVLLCALAGSGVALASTWRSSDSLYSAPYMSTLPLPALRWAGSVPSSTLVQDLAPLAEQLATRARKARDEDRDDSGAADD